MPMDNGGGAQLAYAYLNLSTTLATHHLHIVPRADNVLKHMQAVTAVCTSHDLSLDL